MSYMHYPIYLTICVDCGSSVAVVSACRYTATCRGSVKGGEGPGQGPARRGLAGRASYSASDGVPALGGRRGVGIPAAALLLLLLLLLLQV